VVLVLPDPSFNAERLVSVSNKRGTRFQLYMLTDVLAHGDDAAPQLDFPRLREALHAGRTPVVACHMTRPAAGGVDYPFVLGANLAAQLGAHKLFLVGQRLAPLIGGMERSHLLADEIPALHDRLAAQEGVPHVDVLPFVGESIRRGIPDIVLLEGKPTELFREVFTHDGAGVLFNRVVSAHIRQAQIKDITDISLLLKPEVEAGHIRPVDENQIERDIHLYWVYEIDGLLVGVARLKLYEDMAEMAQFATLPRYRGKGRARELALRLIRAATDLGVHGVFALSVDPRMWRFFESLGFQDTPREALPATWRAGYDMSRPSRAFVKEVEAERNG